MEENSKKVVNRRRDPSYPKGAGDAFSIGKSAREIKEEDRLQSAMEDVNGDVFETESYISESLAVGSRKTTMIAEVLFCKSNFQLIFPLSMNFENSIISAYLWWSVFQAMPGIIWFYPLCLMEISYYEVFGLMWFSPLLMKFRCIRNFVTGPYGLMMMRALTMIGVGSFLASSTILRLVLAAVGNFFALLCLAGMLWDKTRIDR